MRVGTAALGALRRFVMPASCHSCGAPVDSELLCVPCRATLVPWLRTSALPDTREGAPGVAAYALGFDGAARALVHALKFEGVRRAADLFVARVAGVALLAGAGSCDVVVPVPLHRVRERERGYNQSAVLAGGLAARFDLPVADGALLRVRPTRSQTGLSRAGRLENVTGAFRTRSRELTGASVLLVDDVVTTGATLAAASLALLEGGADGVTCFAPAGRPETG
jgi:ComF family protein